MEKNKISEYLKYAVGEIVLVVIGILIALSINNWNEGRKDKLKEQTILIHLEEEYNANLEQLEAKMQLRFQIVKSSLSILKYMTAPKLVSRDSVVFN